jgi:hypothetical protein
VYVGAITDTIERFGRSPLALPKWTNSFLSAAEWPSNPNFGRSLELIICTHGHENYDK